MHELSRRRFVKGAVLTVTGTCVCGIGGCATISGVGNTPPVKQSAYLISENRISVDLNQVPELQKVGGSAKIIDPRLQKSLIVVRTSQDQYIASSIHCTHRGTEVEYHHRESKFQCASLGGSEFHLDGTVIGGPAKGPLQPFQTSLSDKVLLIHV